MTQGLAHATSPPTWTQSLCLMIRWEALSLRMLFVTQVALQMVLGVGLVFAIDLWTAPATAALQIHVAAGAASLAIVLSCVVFATQSVISDRMCSMYEYRWTLPVHHTAVAGAWIVVQIVAALPVATATLVVASLLWGFPLAVVGPWVIAVVLLAASATLIGFGLAHSVSSPEVAAAATQVLLLLALSVSPMLFPADHLPGWLAAVSELMPFGAMATMVRDGLHGGFSSIGTYAVVSMWSVSGLVLGARSLMRIS